MNKLKQLLNKILIKLKIKKPFILVKKSQEVEVGKANVTFILKDGSSSSILLEGSAKMNEKLVIEVVSANEYLNDYIYNFNCRNESNIININPSFGIKMYVRRSDILKLTSVLSTHKIKVEWEEKEYL